MAKPLKVSIVNATTAAAILLAAAVALYALFLLFVGEARTVVPEAPIAEATQEATRVVKVEYVPYSPAVVPLLAAALLLSGLLTRKLLLAWIGLAALLAFGALFLFSIGGGLLPAAGLLLILLTLITIIWRKRNTG